jgi:hypothetical protein
VGVPLPSDETSFLDGRPELREAFTDNGRLAPISEDCDQADSPPHSIMGEWVKSFSLWLAIQLKSYVYTLSAS